MALPSQGVKRISIRWLPDPAFEDTATVALNVGGYFIDLRVATDDQTIQWSHAGERSLVKQDPPTFRWTHIIDSVGLTDPDEAYFKPLPNGDEIEIGVTPAPHKNNVPTAYEEIWRDITAKKTPTELSWILQSIDGTTFIGRVGSLYVSIRKNAAGFVARREDREGSVDGDQWSTTFQSDKGADLPTAMQAIAIIDAPGHDWENGQNVDICEASYTFRAVSRD